MNVRGHDVGVNALLALVAIIFFVLAAFNGGLHTDYQDLIAWGLAFFAAAHLV